MKTQGYLLLFLFLCACGKEVIPDPKAVSLLSPANLESCTTAFEIDADRSQVSFRWGASLHSDAYELVIRKISSGQEYKEITPNTTLNQVLDRGFAYQWWVVSTSEVSLVETSSEKWQFYLEGTVEGDHLPFATQLILPQDEAIKSPGTIQFQWQGFDLDEENLRYSFYLGSDLDAMQLMETAISATNLTLTLTVGNYYWKVVTIDASGNSTSSVPYQLQVQD